MTSWVLASALLLRAQSMPASGEISAAASAWAEPGPGLAPAPAALDTPPVPIAPSAISGFRTFLAGAHKTRVESREAAGGELVTLFQKSANGVDVPVLTYFKDTLDDSDPLNDRLRYVWVLSQKQASPARHLLAAMPFLYSRMPSRAPAAGRLPRPMIDLTKPTGHTVKAAARNISQWQFLDTLGMPVRATTRSYQNNILEQRATRIAQAAAAIESHVTAPDAGESPAIDVSVDRDLAQVRCRLMLSTQMLGGLVTDESLPMIHEKDIARREQNRGHNWELLRDQAELNGLYFQPLRLSGGPPSHGILWVSRDDLNRHYYRKFEGRFLKISNPWNDRGLRKWRGYTEVWTLNGKSTEMIPLAVYGFDHPKVPHLLVSMRDPHGPRRKEMIRRAFGDTLSGVVGFSRFANWEYFAGITAWNFVSARRGAPNNRALRARSYGEFQYRLSHDTALNPRLRGELMRQVSRLSVNPLDESTSVDTRTALIQHRALMQWAAAPDGLASWIQKDRREELAMMRRPAGRKVLTHAARWFSLGIYRPQAKPGENALAELRDRRREQTRLSLMRKPAAQPQSEAGVSGGGQN